MTEVCIVDYGIGNLSSISNMLKKVGGEGMIISEADKILAAKKIILPGIGAFDTGMLNLIQRNLDGVIREAVDKGAYLLGICLGMQLLFEKSEEGKTRGLSLLGGEVKKISFTDNLSLKIPHMGWNFIKPIKNSHLFLTNDEQMRFYFVHSYHVSCAAELTSATTHYGYEFPAAVEKNNVMGVQFHPEKSHKFGMKILKRFLEIPC